LGVIPAMLKDLYELRRKYKKLAKDATDPDEQMVYDKKQYAIKIILNSTYGALGFPIFRIYTP
jgi:DNA polymerase elongation subunit (family B)